jgi:hypothetical protein
MTNAYVRVRGGAFDRVFARRCLDFVYAVFPDAKLYACGEFGGLMVKNEGDVCGFAMSMNFSDPASNPWAESGA